MRLILGFSPGGSGCIWTSAGTPAPVAATLHAAFTQALRTPAIDEKLESQGATPDPSASPEQFAQFVRDDAARWKTIVARWDATVQ